MRTIVSILLVSALCISVIGQTNFQSGIYREFDEIRFSQPSGIVGYEVTETLKHYAPRKEIVYYKLDIPRKEAKELGKILAFSDGKDLYISTGGPKLALRPGFVKAELIGEYYFYEEIVSTPVITNDITYISLSRGQTILDKSTGKKYLLSSRKLKTIIAEDEELLASFKTESGKKDKLKDYLVRFYSSN